MPGVICDQQGCEEKAAWLFTWPFSKGKAGICPLHRSLLERAAHGLAVDVQFQELEAE